jgi:hypothetical protein
VLWSRLPFENQQSVEQTHHVPELLLGVSMSTIPNLPLQLEATNSKEEANQHVRHTNYFPKRLHWRWPNLEFSNQQNYVQEFRIAEQLDHTEEPLFRILLLDYMLALVPTQNTEATHQQQDKLLVGEPKFRLQECAKALQQTKT